MKYNLVLMKRCGCDKCGLIIVNQSFVTEISRRIIGVRFTEGRVCACVCVYYVIRIGARDNTPFLLNFCIISLFLSFSQFQYTCDFHVPELSHRRPPPIINSTSSPNHTAHSISCVFSELIATKFLHFIIVIYYHHYIIMSLSCYYY